MKQVVLFLLLLPLWIVAEEPGAVQDSDVVVDVGSNEHRAQLGYGWSRNEFHGNRSMAWIKKHEADLDVSLVAGKGYTCWLHAQPFLIKDKFQNIGVYINGTFISSSSCKYEDAWEWHRFEIPAERVRADNRVIIRLGYVRKPKENDKRKLGLLVDHIIFRPTH